MRLEYVLFALLLIARISSLCQVKRQEKAVHVCLKSVKDTRCTCWKDFKKKISKLSLTNVEINFSPGSVYNLSRKLTITNAKNVSLLSNSTGECFAIINCTQRSMLAIANSTSIKIKNIEFIGCGYKSRVLFGKEVFPKTTAAVIALYNVSSVTVLECVFCNSYGHSILGFAVEKNITIMKVKFIQNTISNVRVFQGGILLYNDDKLDSIKNVNLSIRQCYFSGIQNTWNSLLNNSGIEIKNKDVNSAVLGVVTYQHNVSTKIEILDTTVNSIASKHGALINSYFSVKSRCSIHIANCSFSNNTVNNASIINIQNHLLTQSNSSKDHYYFNFTITATRFQTNTASDTVINITGNSKTVLLKSIDIHGNRVQGALLYVSTTNLRSSHFNICNCTVKSNIVVNGSGLVLVNITNSVFVGRNSFNNNSIGNGNVIVLNQTGSSFMGNTDFSFNQAGGILSIHNYTTFCDGATINLSNNFNNVSNNSALISVTVESHAKYNPCAFQFITSNSAIQNKLDSVTNAVTEEANKGYKHIMFGSRLNSCYWLNNSAYRLFSPGEVYKAAIHFDEVTDDSMKVYQNVCICTKSANTSDCITDQLGSVIPGAAIHFQLKLLPPFTKSAVYIDDRTLLPNNNITPCQITPSSPKVHLVQNDCTNITYEIATPKNATHLKMCSLYMNVVNGESLSAKYVCNIRINECSPGLVLYETVCECDKRLIKAIPGFQCSYARYPYITRPSNYWLAYSNDSDLIQYAECSYDYCLPGTSPVDLQYPDTQCLYKRAGIVCGKCHTGLSTMIGSSQCKECSNWWLLLLPVFLSAGLLLVLALFVLNPTVADGKINGFSLYVNILSINSSRLFPKRGVAYTILSLCNLDLGIETCFYNGMSEYSKTWLRLSYPFYLYLLVGILAFVSRYSSKVERITRRRVIPVIATLMLLSFTKLLLVTSSVLFSYMTVHSIGRNYKYHATKRYWAVDTSVLLFGLRFSFLFVACLLLFLFFFIPVTIGLIFTKTSYRFNVVVRYIKPFFDVYQAPYKSDSHYVSGISLIIRVVAVSVTSSLSTSKVVAINLVLAFTYLLYFAMHKPFKSQVNQYIYVSYIFNLGCVPVLIIYHNYNLSKYYNITLNILVFIALLEFAVILIYYFCKNVLKWNVDASHLRLMIQLMQNKATLHKDDSLKENTEDILAVLDYAEFREDQLEMKM